LLALIDVMIGAIRRKRRKQNSTNNADITVVGSTPVELLILADVTLKKARLPNSTALWVCPNHGALQQKFTGSVPGGEET
jgi:hypothetical protein